MHNRSPMRTTEMSHRQQKPHTCHRKPTDMTRDPHPAQKEVRTTSTFSCPLPRFSCVYTRAHTPHTPAGRVHRHHGKMSECLETASLETQAGSGHSVLEESEAGAVSGAAPLCCTTILRGRNPRRTTVPSTPRGTCSKVLTE